MFSISHQEAVLLLVIIVILVSAAYFYGRVLRSADIKKERQDALGRSRSVLLWEVYEKIAPFLPDFPYKPKDMVFLGKGIDYIVLDGLAEGKVPKIIFLELKSGTSRLNKNEELIRSAVEMKKIEFQTLKLDGF